MTAWDAVNYLLLAAGLVALVLGYRRSNRNMLLCAGLLLLAFNGIEDFADGFAAGYAGSNARAL
ncbi:hypothetical protein [Stenotrophomonas lactitubi]|uniref:hypothetical protein n=1 Tax=Stenotrophomonas lactitubi TaxID=2045214 RepID=UPI001DD457F7|nr:hypothetical protein [Stenotrophomonas lactitubi]CAH0179952.1 hypothetical protein SRABI102_01246 [Stenotrophomonas lactitubi]CAH0183180.1 hypothetical protein SRABI122_01475 [Stenotrophomonas lactitubi]CAH0211018.1 hypothetical protein SRABI66_02185 [Stenotrophomonas lactitubi]CAH0217506.1 hypothetical protein SRABI81_02347 [Stenotrophomonas lactitubi]